jgi:ATP-binding cassette subfamily B protein
MCATPLALLVPLPLKIAVDSVLGDLPLPAFLNGLLPVTETHNLEMEILLIAALVVAIALLTQLQKVGNAVLGAYTGEQLALGFRSQLFQHAQRLSLSYHDTYGAANSTFRIQYDAPAIQWILIDGIAPFLTALFTLVGMIGVTLWIDWQLALVALAISPFLFIVSRIYSPRLRGQWHEVYRLQSSAISVVQEVLDAIRVVRAFGQETREQKRFMGHAKASFGVRLRVAFVEGQFGLIVGLAIALGTAAVLYIGVHHVQSGKLTLGELLLVMTYLAQIYGPLETLSRMVTSLQRSLASAERTFALLDQEPDVPDRTHAQALTRATGDFEFCRVSFGYDDACAVFEEVSLCIKAGTRVGIAGVTGAGKSTLVSLLMRFYDPKAGQILLDGVDLRDYKLADLRNQFAVVPQELTLFSTSIAENIAYARPHAHEDEIIAAATAAHAHDFIVGLPDGYHTAVGERGMQLSGGERQRIALARAFLKDAPILILDEPTSAIDVQTEAMIMAAMERLMDNRTTFMIAHRLSTLEQCDMRLEVKDGRVTTCDATGRELENHFSLDTSIIS